MRQSSPVELRIRRSNCARSGSDGAKVAIFDVNEAEGQAVAGEIGGLFVPCNVADAESAERAVAAPEPRTAARILVICAGIAPAGKIVGRGGPMALDAFRRVIDVNLNGSFNVMRLCAPVFRKCRRSMTANAVSLYSLRRSPLWTDRSGSRPMPRQKPLLSGSHCRRRGNSRPAGFGSARSRPAFF